MFERYTEHARRCILLGRYEASMFGSQEIAAEHLLLGILRDDKRVASQLDMDADAIRKELEQLAPPKERVSTSVDMPLSHESKQVLRFGAEEADALNHKHIDTSHLVLGLLRVEESLAAKLLRAHGLAYERYREAVAKGAEEGEVT
jgi:ATP-dependent Clp protease ATP-binding subunit ClpC